MVGIEFTSNFTEAIFVGLSVAVLLVIILLFRRIKQSKSLLAVVRRENSKLRNEIANITGWTADGRLPDNWQDKLQSTHAASETPHSADSERGNVTALEIAHRAFLSIDPPFYASHDEKEVLEHEHKRIAELLDNLMRGKIDPQPAIANGEFDKLICVWRRLEAYFPDESETFIYGIAGNAVLEYLSKNSIQVIAPRPLTVVSANSCVLSTDDVERLRDISRVRAAAVSARAKMTKMQSEDEIVIDCQTLGWSSPNGKAKPRILIIDKSW